MYYFNIIKVNIETTTTKASDKYDKTIFHWKIIVKKSPNVF